MPRTGPEGAQRERMTSSDTEPGAGTSAPSLTVARAEPRLREAGVSGPGPSCCLPLTAVSPGRAGPRRAPSPHWPGRGDATPGGWRGTCFWQLPHLCRRALLAVPGFPGPPCSPPENQSFPPPSGPRSRPTATPGVRRTGRPVAVRLCSWKGELMCTWPPFADPADPFCLAREAGTPPSRAETAGYGPPASRWPLSPRPSWQEDTHAARRRSKPTYWRLLCGSKGLRDGQRFRPGGCVADTQIIFLPLPSAGAAGLQTLRRDHHQDLCHCCPVPSRLLP